MKKMTLLSLVAITVLFTACGEETKKVAAEVNTTAVAEAVKKDTISAVEAAAKKAAEVKEATEAKAAELKVAAAAKVAEAAAAVQEKAVELTAPDAFTKCKACHGADGKTKALGKSAIIAGQDKEALITSLKAYKAGTKNVAGMGSLMKGQVSTMSDEEIEAVAEYLSKI